MESEMKVCVYDNTTLPRVLTNLICFLARDEKQYWIDEINKKYGDGLAGVLKELCSEAY